MILAINIVIVVVTIVIGLNFLFPGMMERVCAWSVRTSNRGMGPREWSNGSVSESCSASHACTCSPSEEWIPCSKCEKGQMCLIRSSWVCLDCGYEQDGISHRICQCGEEMRR